MTSTTLVVAPPYHVQSTAAELRSGYPYFSHHDSVSALWAKKWRAPCQHGIYPFTDANVEDFDSTFASLVSTSNDDTAILARLPSETIAGLDAGLTHEIAQVAQSDLAHLSWLRKRAHTERE